MGPAAGRGRPPRTRAAVGRCRALAGGRRRPGIGPVLAAGPWATGDPATLNPSYWAPGVFQDLADRTGDPRWSRLAESALDMTGILTEAGWLLPPDWARVDGSVVSAT